MLPNPTVDFWVRLQRVANVLSLMEVSLLGDLNGPAGSSGDEYEGMHGGYGFGTRNVDGEGSWNLKMKWRKLCATHI